MKIELLADELSMILDALLELPDDGKWESEFVERTREKLSDIFQNQYK